MSKRIMLIMPSTAVRSTFSTFLKDMGYQVFVQDRATHAISFCQKIDPDLVLCYESLDGRSCTELADQFRSSHGSEKKPFIMVSPNPTTEGNFEVNLKKLKVDDLIRLPIEQGELYGYVTNWLETDDPHSISPKFLGAAVVEQPVRQSVGPAAKNGKPWDKGTVGLTSMGRLFFQLTKRKATGTLLFKGERRKMKVWIDSGEVVDVQSNYMRDDTLGRYLIDIGKLTEEQCEVAVQYAAGNSLQLGGAIAKLGYASTAQTAQYITDHKILKLLNVFQRRWYKSKFAFKLCNVDSGPTEFVRTPLSRIIGDGILNVARKKDLYEVFFSKNKETKPLCICDQFDQLANSLSLGPAQVRQAMQLSGCSLEQIKQSRSDQFENNLRLAFLLLVTKGMKFAA
jgi:CheY-like chemotaxis protein